MYLLPCSDCDESVPVTAAQAGGQTGCPHCGAALEIPNLGQLRQLAASEPPGAALPGHAASRQGGRQVGFALFAFVAAGAFLVSGYCGIRWIFTDVPMTTEEHIARLRVGYQSIEPARLINEYQEMEKYGLDLPQPFAYQAIAEARRAWGRNGLIAGAIGLVGLVGAFLFGTAARQAARPRG